MISVCQIRSFSTSCFKCDFTTLKTTRNNSQTTTSSLSNAMQPNAQVMKQSASHRRSNSHRNYLSYSLFTIAHLRHPQNASHRAQVPDSRIQATATWLIRNYDRPNVRQFAKPVLTGNSPSSSPSSWWTQKLTGWCFASVGVFVVLRLWSAHTRSSWPLVPSLIYEHLLFAPWLWTVVCLVSWMVPTYSQLYAGYPQVPHFPFHAWVISCEAWVLRQAYRVVDSLVWGVLRKPVVTCFAWAWSNLNAMVFSGKDRKDGEVGDESSVGGSIFGWSWLPSWIFVPEWLRAVATALPLPQEAFRLSRELLETSIVASGEGSDTLGNHPMRHSISGISNNFHNGINDISDSLMANNTIENSVSPISLSSSTTKSCLAILFQAAPGFSSGARDLKAILGVAAHHALNTAQSASISSSVSSPSSLSSMDSASPQPECLPMPPETATRVFGQLVGSVGDGSIGFGNSELFADLSLVNLMKLQNVRGLNDYLGQGSHLDHISFNRTSSTSSSSLIKSLVQIQQHNASHNQSLSSWLHWFLVSPWSNIRFEGVLFVLGCWCLGRALKGLASIPANVVRMDREFGWLPVAWNLACAAVFLLGGVLVEWTQFLQMAQGVFDMQMEAVGWVSFSSLMSQVDGDRVPEFPLNVSISCCVPVCVTHSNWKCNYFFVCLKFYDFPVSLPTLIVASSALPFVYPFLFCFCFSRVALASGV